MRRIVGFLEYLNAPGAANNWSLLIGVELISSYQCDRRYLRINLPHTESDIPNSTVRTALARVYNSVHLSLRLGALSAGHRVLKSDYSPRLRCCAIILYLSKSRTRCAKKRGGSQAQVAEQADETIETPFFEVGLGVRLVSPGLLTESVLHHVIAVRRPCSPPSVPSHWALAAASCWSLRTWRARQANLCHRARPDCSCVPLCHNREFPRPSAPPFCRRRCLRPASTKAWVTFPPGCLPMRKPCPSWRPLWPGTTLQLSSCVLFYMIEVAAILSVMQQFPDDARKAEAVPQHPTQPFGL
ncbi:hypothetical protein HaLaN_27905 [Haematococcus lacustris]|uniref:Uncharacterized protein n=1 Tax=Haematococcus lacustris TaxID=44745 RepID=A0A6A0A961_HAELA|nr:hypothetical protein HaLaN_27905 [Haematococcus lacustris]